MLALVADIAVRAATLNPFFEDNVLTETPGIVLVDELDLHLHPKWQRKIVNDLRSIFPKIQFITTTHAPQILVRAGPGEVSLLRRDEETQRIHVCRQDIPPGLCADQVLTGEWFGLLTRWNFWINTGFCSEKGNCPTKKKKDARKLKMNSGTVWDAMPTHRLNAWHLELSPN